MLLPIAASLPVQGTRKKRIPQSRFLSWPTNGEETLLGCLGKEPVQTPHLDRLASEGVLFTNAVSCYPVSSPARGILMSGMYPMNNKVIGKLQFGYSPYGVNCRKQPVAGVMS